MEEEELDRYDFKHSIVRWIVDVAYREKLWGYGARVTRQQQKQCNVVMKLQEQPQNQ